MTTPGTFSNLGRWSWWYRRVTTRRPMGAALTYKLAAAWLEPCRTVVDWGCGPGGARPYFAGQDYRGLDGTMNPFVDEVVDLTTHTVVPPADGLLLRHVLEHNYDWRAVLTHALASFRHRMCLVFFVPFEDAERVVRISTNQIPVIALRRRDVDALIIAAGVSIVRRQAVLAKSAEFGEEELYYLERS